MAGYDFAAIEAKWQNYWQEHQTFRQPNPGQDGFVDKPKCYVLDMFPYPSGAGLHVGHPEGYTATDIIARYARMKGYNVLHPMGYDSFGLPAQQYAVEHGIHPRVTTERNIANIERQIKSLGFSYDWSRRVATTDPAYYRWTQWIFLQMFNSWYDPQANSARPISELIDALGSGKYLIDVDGNIVPARSFERLVALNLQAAGNGLLKFIELDPDQQRRLIDEYRLAYLAEVPVNWCPMLGTVLANEEVTNEGKSDRGDHPVYRRALKQWMLRITAYADRLMDDLEGLDWPQSIKTMQRNWIGKSTGAEVDFPLACRCDEWFAQRQADGFPASAEEDVIRVYTTRPDTLFGATYMVLAPEHPLVERITTAECRQAVEQYVRQAARKSELERTAQTKEKTGVFSGTYAINPVNRQQIPIWVADYVMTGYGTGAIMAVPAHDTRDLEFARQFNLPVIQVVNPPEGADWQGYVDDGVAVNSGKYDGLSTEQFKKQITGDLTDAGLGREAVNYKLRDWVFSRQWYWGEPFPIVHCDDCGVVDVPQDQLPVLLPDLIDFQPQACDDPDAPPSPPLGRASDWVNVPCPRCSRPARRELNAMPQWAGSCWYYLRYLDPKNDRAFCDPKIERYWMKSHTSHHKPAKAEATLQAHTGVDLYVGGAEHAVLHLLYARFWHKVLFDLGYVSMAEPFGRLFNQGMIRSFAYRDRRGIYVGYDQIDFREDGAYHKQTGEKLSESVEKMSKSLKNVVNPDDVVSRYGADTFRLYEMFMGPLESSKPWNTRDVPGVHRFCQRIWRMLVGNDANQQQAMLADGQQDAEIERALHQLIKKVGSDIEAMKFNTAIAAMMEFVNTVYRRGRISPDQARRFVLVLAPFVPHLGEELWSRLGGRPSLAYEAWPAYDEAKLVQDQHELAVQVNGKVRGRISVPADADQEQIIEAALAEPKVAQAIEGKTIVKRLVIAGRLVSIVVK